MRYGRTVENGFLPVYSVDTEEEAKDLLIMACSTNQRGEFVATELVMRQTLENLKAFGTRLKETHEKMLKMREEQAMVKTKTKRYAKKTPMQKQRAARKATEEQHAKKQPTNKPKAKEYTAAQKREMALEAYSEQVLDLVDELGGTDKMSQTEFLSFLENVKDGLDLRSYTTKQDMAREET